MSLEQAIEANTLAIRDLIATYANASSRIADTVGTRSTDLVDANKAIGKVQEKVKVETKKSTKPESSASSAPSTTDQEKPNTQDVTAEATAASETVEADTSAADSSASDTPTVDYPMLQKAILALVPKDRNKAIAIMSEFGATKGPEIKPEDYAACYAKFAEALGIGQDTDSLA